MPTVEGNTPGLGTQPFEVTTLIAPLAKPAGSYALPPVAIENIQEIKPIHVIAGAREHDSVFSNIMILGALSAPAALYPLVLQSNFQKLGKPTTIF